MVAYPFEFAVQVHLQAGELLTDVLRRRGLFTVFWRGQASPFLNVFRRFRPCFSTQSIDMQVLSGHVENCLSVNYSIPNVNFENRTLEADGSIPFSSI